MRKNEKMSIQEKKLEAVKMRKNEIMSEAINSFILDNEFLMRFITDNVRERIYDKKYYKYKNCCQEKNCYFYYKKCDFMPPRGYTYTLYRLRLYFVLIQL